MTKGTGSDKLSGITGRIDAHIHLDLYEEGERETVFTAIGRQVDGVIAVSMHEASCEKNLACAIMYPGRVYPAFGFHPEQALPDAVELDRLFDWIERHQDEAIAIGEVGLPYYTRQEAAAAGTVFDVDPYIDLLDRFIRLAVRLDKPIVLHAVYEDAEIACDLLEKHGNARAHFHWFKGSDETVRRMAAKGYMISITPDICYEDEIRSLVRRYPIELIMAETDGPWTFEGPFTGQMTTPGMVSRVIEEIASIKGKPVDETERQIFRNTTVFYQI